MSLTTSDVEALAPDQASLNAASKLLKPAKWPTLEFDSAGGSMIWGECQGSGANPYRVVTDKEDHGYKCTCPSRKFPCKHALALMWMYAEGNDSFQPGTVPDWALDWVSRRRNKGTKPETSSSGEKKSLSSASAPSESKPLDPKAEARKKAANRKRAEQTLKSLFAATEDLDQWIEDQLEAGLSTLQSELTDRCRQIAARLVDGKAATLAGRVDELPSRILSLNSAIQPEALLTELGKLVLINRAWRADPLNPELRSLLTTAETRQELLENESAHRVKDHWEVLGEMIKTRRDGLVAQTTWLLRLGEQEAGPRFALLLDFYPASAGKRGSTQTPGDQFEAEVVFYPGKTLQRAVIDNRGESLSERKCWPSPNTARNPLERFQTTLHSAPWMLEVPLLLSSGRVATSEDGIYWWQPAKHKIKLPLTQSPSPLSLGCDFDHAVGIWNGYELKMISGITNWGRVDFEN